MHQATQSCLLFFSAAICNKNNHNLAFRNLNLDAQLGSTVGKSLHTGSSINFGSGSLTDKPTGTPSSVLLLIGFFCCCSYFALFMWLYAVFVCWQPSVTFYPLLFWCRYSRSILRLCVFSMGIKKEASPLVLKCNQNIPNSSAATRGCHILLTWFDCDPELG